jgi:hypothetical protein
MKAVAAICGLIAVLSAVDQAKANGITYDCDTAAEHFSELRLPATAPFRVSGRVQLLAKERSSRYAPLARVAIADEPETTGPSSRWSGFTFTNLAGSHGVPSGMLAYETVSRGSPRTEDNLGLASARDITFSITFDGTRVSGAVDGHEFGTAFSSANPSVQINCSTGDFLFSNIEIVPLTTP